MKTLASLAEIKYSDTFKFQEINMVRISKQAERRAKSPRKHRAPSEKTGTRKDNLPNGFKAHPNALEDAASHVTFIPKIK